MKKSSILCVCGLLVIVFVLMGCPPEEPPPEEPPPEEPPPEEPPPEEPPPEEPPPEEELLNISVNNLHFGVDIENGTYEIEKKFVIQNIGSTDSNVFFDISLDKPWIHVTPNNGNISGGDATTITVIIDRGYTESKELDFSEGTLVIETANQKHTVGVTTAPDYYTEVFDAGEFDLEGKHLWLTPSGGPSYYTLQIEQADNRFTTNPAGGVLLDFELFGDPEIISPQFNALIPFYGNYYETMYVSSGGWVSFGEQGNNPDSLDDHFEAPQLSALPVDAFGQGMVSALQDGEKLIITYEDVPSKDDPTVTNDFQVELYYDGRICVTYLNVDPLISGVVGLSAGVGEEPEDFLESNLYISLNTKPLGVKLN